MTLKIYYPADSYKNENVNMSGINVISQKIKVCSESDKNSLCWNPRKSFYSDFEIFQNVSETIKIPMCNMKMYDCMIDFHYNFCALYNIYVNHLENIITIYSANGSCSTKDLLNCTAIYQKIYIANKYSYDCNAYFSVPIIGKWDVICTNVKPSTRAPLSSTILLIISTIIIILTLVAYSIHIIYKTSI